MAGGFVLGRVPGLAVAAVACSVGCASVEGLDQFKQQTGCTDCSEPDATTTVDATQPEDSSSDVAEPDVPIVASDAPEWGYDDAPSAEDAGGDGPEASVGGNDGGSPADAGVPRDAGGHLDASLDAGRGAVDAAPDAPACTSASCSEGCCTASGLCAGGGLTSACGMGGAACRDCASYGLACVDQACVTPPADAGSTTSGCTPSTCSNLCVPYFVQCCKSDQSCGCALLFPPGPCN